MTLPLEDHALIGDAMPMHALGALGRRHDPAAKRLVGNFPQAFTHVSLVNSACNLSGGDHGRARHRSHHHVDG